MMTHLELIDELLNKKMTVLAGAGISYDSGLPIVSAFYEHFLPALYDAEDVAYVQELINSGHIPFERMMEHIFNYTENDYSIMDIFDNGEPNSLHFILAQMMHSGWVDELYTTNFDVLMEQSLESIGLTSKDFKVFYNEKGFAKLASSNSDKKVIKLHGTIKEKDSIRTTLKTITSQQNLLKRKPPVERLFSSGSHEVVIVMGYSFSDVFDINLFIDKINVNKVIVVIEHEYGKGEDLNLQMLNGVKMFGNRKNPFFQKECHGYVVKMDTLLFMSELCKTKYTEVPVANPVKYDWKNYLNDWLSKFDSIQRTYIAGGICNSMNVFNVANKYMTRAFQSVDPGSIELYTSIANQYVLSRFRVRKEQKECDDLIRLCEQSIQLLKDNKQNLSNDFYLLRMDDLTFRMARIYEDGYFNLKEALRCYFSAYRIEYKQRNLLEMSITLHQMGIVYAGLGTIKLAVKCFKRSIRFKKHCGYVGGIARSYYTLAAEILKDNPKKIKLAESYLNQAIQNAEIVGELDLVLRINNLKGTIFMQRHLWDKAESVLSLNLEMLKKQPDEIILATTNYNLARCKLRLKQFESALNLLDDNIIRVTRIGNIMRIIRHNQELALACLLNGNIAKCYDHLFSNLALIDSAPNSEKAHYFFYIALYYKKHNHIEYYKQFHDLSKFYFKGGKSIRDFNRLKVDFENEIVP
ncbi:MAG TPA: SIR2 family protein, partial [Bacteroidia bacterium]